LKKGLSSLSESHENQTDNTKAILMNYNVNLVENFYIADEFCKEFYKNIFLTIFLLEHSACPDYFGGRVFLLENNERFIV
jgi:hypothetical protein